MPIQVKPFKEVAERAKLLLRLKEPKCFRLNVAENISWKELLITTSYLAPYDILQYLSHDEKGAAFQTHLFKAIVSNIKFWKEAHA